MAVTEYKLGIKTSDLLFAEPYQDDNFVTIADLIEALQTDVQALQDAGFVKKDGTINFEAVVQGILPTISAHLATKGYVDGLIPTPKPAFNGVLTLGQTLTAADLDCVERVYRMTFAFDDFTFPAGLTHNFVLLTVPPGTFVTGYGGFYSKHEIEWVAPGLTDLAFTALLDFTAQDAHVNSFLDSPPSDFLFQRPLVTGVGQIKSPDAMGSTTFTIDAKLVATGANLDTLTAGELDVWIRMSILEDNPSVKFS